MAETIMIIIFAVLLIITIHAGYLYGHAQGYEEGWNDGFDDGADISYGQMLFINSLHKKAENNEEQ